MRFAAVPFVLFPLVVACDDSAKVCRDTLERLKAEVTKNQGGDTALTLNSSTLKAERADGGTNCVVDGTIPNNPFGMRFAWRVNPVGRFIPLGFEPFMR